MSGPLSLSAIITDKTIASVMHAVYFSTGPFSDAVDRVRNKPNLWAYKNPRQAENEEGRKRAWEGMLMRYRGEMLRRGWRLEDGEKEGSDQMHLDSGAQEEAEVSVAVAMAMAMATAEEKMELRTERGEREGVAGSGKEEDEEVEKKASIQTQSKWTEVQLEFVGEGVGKPEEKVEEARVMPKAAVREQYRTAVDYFEFEAPKPASGW